MILLLATIMTLWQGLIMTPTLRWVFGLFTLSMILLRKVPVICYFEDFIPWIFCLLITWKVVTLKFREISIFLHSWQLLLYCVCLMPRWGCLLKSTCYIMLYLLSCVHSGFKDGDLSVNCCLYGKSVLCDIIIRTVLLLEKWTVSDLDVSWPWRDFLDCLIWSLLRLVRKRALLSHRRKLAP